MSSAIGLGNLLRFPGVVYNADAGLAFFIPYGLGLTLVGIPILTLELVLGQTSRSGDLLAFGNIHKRLRGIGVASAHTSYTVALYYNVIIAWILLYFVRSFQSNLPWAAGTGERLTVSADYFSNNIVQAVANPSDTKHIIGATFVAGIFAWAFVYLSISKGVLTAGRVVQFTMTLPTIFVAILVIRGVTLTNAGAGIELYFGRFDISKLSVGSVWVDAISHIFFSIGIGFGVMTAYASYNSRHQDAVQDAFIIGFSNSAFEVIAGFSVFGVIGFLGPENVKGMVGTFSMGFITYPVALSNLPAPQFWNVLFFFTLFLLGLGSAFSLVEGASTTLKDSRWLSKYPGQTISGVLCIIGVLFLGLYASDIGIHALDTVDTFINSIGMIFLGLVKVWAAGTWYRADEARHRVGSPAFFLFNAAWVVAPIAGTIIGYVSNLAIGLGVGLGLCAVLAVGGCSLAMKHGGRSAIFDLFFFQSRELVNDINSVIATRNQTRLPIAWAVIIKYITTPALCILQVVTYRGVVVEKIDMPMSWLGLTFALLVPLMLMVGLVAPDFYTFLVPIKKPVVDVFDHNQITGDEITQVHQERDKSAATVT
ncbi:hypothetical protein PhCBS80983_g05937 [Powellomyces hirtus]|uniref:Amino acid transporter transmembrane domain-containing protein n=1 Tax=Powellomyces hirtus TaxID=109895 RepID=A0A507DU76_9FUNG|nr:hypothetical protein PhCBS80983_g05937 [Powellomyces hirtus]